MGLISLPNTQALACRTFQSPRALLEDGRLLIPELYDWNGAHNPDHPLFIYDDEENIRTVTWSQATKIIHSTARYVARRSELSSTKSGALPVVAVLATSDSITYFCTVIGIMRAGFTCFAISPRNSPEAVAHLLSATQSAFLLVSSESSMMTLAETALSMMSDSGKAPRMVPMPFFEDMFAEASADSFIEYPKIAYNPDSIALILHSSGSTAFPKPIYWKHRSLPQRCWILFHGHKDMAGVTVGWHAMPLYHGMGSLAFFFAPSAGMVLGVFKPRSPTTHPTAENFFNSLKASKCEMACTVPTFLEQWSVDPQKVAYLSTLKGVLFGGGPLAKHAGDSLALKGVRLLLVYGLTECSVVNVVVPQELGLDWNYLEIAAHVPHAFVDQGQDIAELVLLAKGPWKPQVINATQDGHEAYATNDLFMKHPTRHGFWKLHGRKDDQIILSTGEKTNPVPLEEILNTDVRVKAAIMFGRGRFQNGVLIEPKAEYSIDPENVDQVEAFKTAIWPTVERMNNYAPQHSRLFREMILVTSPSKPLSFTPKGTPRRKTILDDYDTEINALYDTVENSVEAGGPALTNFAESDVTSFIRETVRGVMKGAVEDSDDLFQHGCDSLQATWIRNKVARALRSLNKRAETRLPTNFVFRFPSIVGMTKATLQLVGSSQGVQGDYRARVPELQATVAKFINDFPSRPTFLLPRPGDGDVVFVTGTTGGYGCNILAQLSRDSTVKKIYAFNRSYDDIVPRQLFAMQKQGLLEDCMRAAKFEMVEGDLSHPHFGLNPEVYEKLRTSVTHIIHNAWPVDFNLTLKSFEKSLFGVRSLVNFALSSPFENPPQILFVSSIGVFRHPQTPAPYKEEPLEDPVVAIGTGYAESKWVAERILGEASERTGLKTVCVRIGQLCGDRNGHWNEKEWFPSLVKSALYVKCLPNIADPGLVHWMPSYESAMAIIAMRNTDEPILHLVNPNPKPMRVFLEPLAKVFGVPLVPYDQWLARLAQDLKDESLSEVEHMKQNPALRLLDYFRHSWLIDGKDLRLDTTKAVKIAPSMLDMKLSPDMVDGWLNSWRRSGFLPPAEAQNGYTI